MSKTLNYLKLDSSIIDTRSNGDEDRLTGYQRASTSFDQSWALTSVGDWSSVTTNGTAVSRTHGPTHELLTSGGQSVTTDVKGNQTVLPSSLTSQASRLSFSWDFDNKLKSSDIDANGSADVNFEYDALGRRVARTQGSTAVVYFQADQQTIADYPRGGSASTATCRYVFASYIDEPVVRKTTGTSGTVLYYHRNQQYSIYALTYQLDLLRRVGFAHVELLHKNSCFAAFGAWKE